MWRPDRISSALSLWTDREARSGSPRDRFAMLMALVTVVCLGGGFFLSKGTQSLMPGALSSAHGTIETCSACHTKSGSGKMSWIHGLVAGDPAADSKACLTCHKMPDTAFNPHGASGQLLKQSTARLTKIAAETPQPQSARAQSIAFPAANVMARDLYCATCHQEHQGTNFKLGKISNEQCRSCHVVKFDSFDGHHPKFEAYPFKRRTRIVYDHAGHFGKHFPDVAKKDPAKRLPDTCSSCHNSRVDKRVMAVAPFDQTCAGCHLNQITGKERASGPKGIAFLSLPGLDLQTLKAKNAAIGEWPDASDAALTPFMKVMISRTERGRALIDATQNLNLQDLSAATVDQVKAVTSLVWEIKDIFHSLIKGKASDVLGDLNIGGGAKLSAALVADLTASIPRDVVVSAHQQWLPNLAAEMANRPSKQKQSSLPEMMTQSRLVVTAATDDLSRSHAHQRATAKTRQVADEQKIAADDSAGAASGERLPLPSGTPRSIEARREAEKAARSKASSEKNDAAKAKADSRKDIPSGSEPDNGTGKDAAAAAKSDEGVEKADGAKADGPTGGAEVRSPEAPAPGKAGEQTDDLLFPTADELRGIEAGGKEAEKAAPSKGASGTATAKADAAQGAGAGPKADAAAPTAPPPANAQPAAATPQAQVAPVITIESDVDAESWADYGGWYREDYAIYYRPTGHKDKFIYSWLFLTGPQAPKGNKSPVAAVFDVLTAKDAQGSCTKCHSVDDIAGRGRVVNFAPASVQSKQGRFTTFIHEPHFGVLENRGCLTCHSLEKTRPYLKSYEQGNPQNFASNFGDVKKDLCQTCHTASKARQDCLLCHQYHVNGVVTPIMSTKLPTP